MCLTDVSLCGAEVFAWLGMGGGLSGFWSPWAF